MSSNKTTNFRLHSWAGLDKFSRSEMNENFSLIDSQLAANTLPFQSSKKTNVISGSLATIQGNTTSGSPLLKNVADVKDFKIGQSMIVAGAGPAVREVVAVVIETDALAPGTVTLTLPGESVKTFPVVASAESVALTFSGTVVTTGEIIVVVDGVEFNIPVTAGESAATVADRVRNWVIENWTADTATGTTVTFTHTGVGRRLQHTVYANGTGLGVNSPVLTAGTQSIGRDLANAFDGSTYTTWDKTRYSNSSLIYFYGKTNGAKGGQNATIDFGTTGITGRLDVVQFGSYLRTKIMDIQGTTIVMENNASATVTGAYVVHEDSRAIQDLLNGAAGGTLLLHPGFFRIHDELVSPSDLVVQGSGKGVTIFASHGINHNGIRLPDGAKNINISQLQIRNVAAPQGYLGFDGEVSGICIQGATNVRVEHCKFDNCDDSGISARYTPDAVRNPARNVKVFYCDFVNIAEGSGVEAITSHDVEVASCYFFHIPQHGIRLCGTKDSNCHDNRFEQCDDAISVQGFGTGSIITRPVDRFLISGNRIYNSYTQGIKVFNQARNGNIINNLLSSNAGISSHGIHLEGTRDANGRLNAPHNVKVENNIIIGSPRPIRMSGSGRRINITNNELHAWASGTLSSTTDIAGIHMTTLPGTVDGTFTDVRIEDNTLWMTFKNKMGIRLDSPAADTKVYVHNNKLYGRFDNPGVDFPTKLLSSNVSGDPNIVKTKNGVDTNEYIQLP